MAEKTTDQMIKEIHSVICPEKQSIPELISQNGIAKLYGKSIHWFPNFKVKKKLVIEPVKMIANNKFYNSKEVIETLKNFGYEPK